MKKGVTFVLGFFLIITAITIIAFMLYMVLESQGVNPGLDFPLP